MKYKILPIIVVICLIFSGIGVVAIEIKEETKEETNIQKAENKIIFSQKTITPEGEYFSVNVEGANTFLMKARKPMLPVYTETFTFPFRTKIKSVDCIMLSDIHKEIIPGKIKPAPTPIPLIYQEKNTKNDTYEKIIEDATVYNSSNLYPDRWYDYNIGCGLDGDEHVVFLRVRYYPVRYSPLENTIHFVDGIDIKITYEEPLENPMPSAKEYDLLIITPKKFSLRLKPLVIHKNIQRVRTVLKTTEWIYANYEGRDKPEQIKYFIKDAIDPDGLNWGVKYVLLVGGMNSLISGTPRDDLNQASESWHVPVRYTNLYENPDYSAYIDPGYICDLYYADIYKGEGEFEDWDSNGNDIFAEWTWKYNETSQIWELDKKDILDLYPDVYVGRLACRNIFEVGIMSRKIIRYETRIFGKRWFNKMILVGGDTFASKYDDYYEGEIETNLSASYMEGFKIIKIWASLDATFLNFIRKISRGAGFVHMTGHGNPNSWGTHPPHDGRNWTIEVFITDMIRLRNLYKLPVVVVGGCHSSQFNVTVQSTLNDRGNSNKTWCYGSLTPQCWSWWLTRKIGGGSIATIGNTGLGYGIPGSGCTSGVGGWIETRFFYVYAKQNKHTLGEAHSQAITDYIKEFGVTSDYVDCKTVEQWLLLGDPSLKIG